MDSAHGVHNQFFGRPVPVGWAWKSDLRYEWLSLSVFSFQDLSLLLSIPMTLFWIVLLPADWSMPCITRPSYFLVAYWKDEMEPVYLCVCVSCGGRTCRGRLVLWRLLYNLVSPQSTLPSLKRQKRYIQYSIPFISPSVILSYLFLHSYRSSVKNQVCIILWICMF